MMKDLILVVAEGGPQKVECCSHRCRFEKIETDHGRMCATLIIEES